MKHFLLLLFSSAIWVSTCTAQDNPGWLQTEPLSGEEIAARIAAMEPFPGGITATFDPTTSGGPQPAPAPPGGGSSLITPTPVTGGNEADALTPEILALARGLRFDALKICEYVRNHIEFEPYYGCKKGAHLTFVLATSS